MISFIFSEKDAFSFLFGFFEIYFKNASPKFYENIENIKNS